MFQKGDEVICINAEVSGGLLKAGQTYTILSWLSPGANDIGDASKGTVELVGITHNGNVGFWASRFKKVDSGAPKCFEGVDFFSINRALCG
jgi:hypothetical protein